MSIREENKVTMETIVALCKRRGFVFPSAEIYGGFANAYDFGPLGVEMKRNLRELWWRAMAQEREDIVGIFNYLTRLADGLGLQLDQQIEEAGETGVPLQYAH